MPRTRRPDTASPLLDGSTVLVTGASAGIGRALAEQIAARAGELVLVARRVDRLTALAEQMRAGHGALRVHSVGCDLGDDDDVDALLGRVGVDLPAPDVLVANAGVGDAALFDTADWARLARIISVNITATTRLLHAVLPRMVDRGRGGLLVIGSGAGLSLMAGGATYTASKYYVHGLTQTLRADLAGTGVTVTEVCPGPVATEFDAAAGIAEATSGPGRWLRISAQQCAADALAGFDRGQALVFPGRTYRTLMRLQALTPLALQRSAAAKTAKQLRRTPPAPDRA
jgi:short-subunit dehydrogenase